MQNIAEVPRSEVTEVVHEIDLMTEALRDDICYVRDPNVVAMLLCLGKKLVRIQYLKSIKYGNKIAQRVVNFGFAGHDEVYEFAIRSKLNMQSSSVITNVNIGEYMMYMNIIKTVIHSIM